MRLRTVSSVVGLSCVLLSACGGSDEPKEGRINHGSGGNGGADGGGGDGGGSSGSGGSGFEVDGSTNPMSPDACGQDVVEARSRQVNILLVIDKSGSMDEALGSGNRWDAMATAINAALTDTRDTIDFGLDLYPFPDGCQVPATPALTVPIEDGTTGVPKILTEIDGTTPSGSTPTGRALARAHEYFDTGPGADLPGDSYVLLATDGGPNCNGTLTCEADACTVNMEGLCPIDPANCCASDPESCLDDDATRAEIAALFDLGVHTFVVGIPGSEDFATTLNAFADAGGEARTGDPSYYAVTDASELTDTFRSITRTLVRSCELQLTSEPEDRSLLNVSIDDGEFIPRDDPNGWHLDTSTAPPTVVLDGTTCSEIESTGAERVAVVFGCPSVVIQ
jgi:hypothetical protein